MNKNQASFVVLLTRNTERVIEFKFQLVKEFDKALKTIARLYANPPRQDALKGKREAHEPMMNALKAIRADMGKDTKPVHFMTENKLCNFVVTGQFKTIDERALTNEQALLLEKVRRHNAALIDEGLDYAERKSRLTRFAMRQRTRMIEA